MNPVIKYYQKGNQGYEQLALKLGCSGQTICNIVRGNVKPSKKLLERLVDVIALEEERGEEAVFNYVSNRK